MIAVEDFSGSWKCSPKFLIADSDTNMIRIRKKNFTFRKVEFLLYSDRFTILLIEIYFKYICQHNFGDEKRRSLIDNNFLIYLHKKCVSSSIYT